MRSAIGKSHPLSGFGLIQAKMLIFIEIKKEMEFNPQIFKETQNFVLSDLGGGTEEIGMCVSMPCSSPELSASAFNRVSTRLESGRSQRHRLAAAAVGRFSSETTTTFPSGSRRGGTSGWLAGCGLPSRSDTEVVFVTHIPCVDETSALAPTRFEPVQTKAGLSPSANELSWSEF